MKANTSYLVILTVRFPFSGETFLKYEIKILSDYFERIEVLPTSLKKEFSESACTEEKASLPKNVVVRSDLATACNLTAWDFAKVLNEEFVEAFRERSMRKFVYRCMKAEAVSRMIVNEYLAKGFNPMFYSYWLNANAAALSIVKKDHPRLLAIARGHGSDVISPSRRYYQPLQRMMLEGLDRIYLVSVFGEKYLAEKYPIASNKIELSRLGVENPGLINSGSHDKTVRIVSCSAINSVKRIYRIIDSLVCCNSTRIRWIHFGGGPQEEQMRRFAEKMLNPKKNIEWEIKGNVRNECIHDHYRSEPVDLFVSLSSSEGIPVSIMEAYSYGIPAIATDVGGVSEIVNGRNGFLIDSEAHCYEVARIIEGFAELSVSERNDYRSAAYSEFSDKYDASTNVRRFAESLNRLQFNG